MEIFNESFFLQKKSYQETHVVKQSWINEDRSPKNLSYVCFPFPGQAPFLELPKHSSENTYGFLEQGMKTKEII